MNSATAADAHTASREGPPRRVGLLVLVLAALTAIAPLATDMYVPGFPGVARSLGATDSAVQLSLTAFLVGLAVGQLLLGPVSDNLGRRRVLLTGSTLFVGFSLVCAVAPNVEVLNLARLLEGISGAAGMVVARAVITDWFDGADAARQFSLLAALTSVAPVVAPVLGGAVLGVASWRVVFAVLAGFGVLLVVGVLGWVPESLPPHRRHSGGVSATFAAMGGLLGRRPLVGYVLTLSLVSAALFAYISGSPFVFQGIYGLSPTSYSLVFGVNALGIMASGIAFGRLARRVRVNTLLIFGVALTVVAATVLVVLLMTTGASFVATWVCLFLLVLGVGHTFPATMTIAQAVGKDVPGTTSALLGGGQFVLGALAAPLVGAFGNTSVTPMALLLLVSSGCAALALVTLARPWQRYGEPGHGEPGR